MSNLKPFLTFSSTVSEKAVNFYLATFPHSSLISSETAMGATVTELIIAGQDFIIMGMDSEVPLGSWATSYYFEADSIAEYDRIFTALAAEGTVIMSQEDFNAFKKVSWITDQFGTTWQLVVK